MTKIEDAVGRFDLMTKDELVNEMKLIAIAAEMHNGDIEAIEACRDEGPLFDGDVPSKSHRDRMLEVGAVEKVAVKGEQGYNACTYKGWHIAKIYRALHEGARP